MNNREKSKLDIVSADSVVIETAPVIEVEPEEIEISHGNAITVLIKHDYYSSDSAHGRELLGAFISALQARKADIARIFIADSGVRLMAENNSLYNEFKELYSEVPVVTVCLESLEAYGMAMTDLPANCETLDEQEFASAVIGARGLLILE